MNILPKKRWHVRTKENVARVRRDEAKAAEEENRKLERALLAENERRLELLRKNADSREEGLFGVRSSTLTVEDPMPSASTHVNFFSDLEREERKNLGTGNKDYEKEKAEERKEWESKMGILKHLGEGSNELEKKKEWWEELPLRRAEVKPKEKRGLPSGVTEFKREELASPSDKRKRKHSSSSSSNSDSSRKKKKKQKKEKKKHKKHKKRRDKESEKAEEEERRRRKMEELREQRLERERAEAARTNVLLHPESVVPEKKPKYNSQFNPHLAKW